jgi:hypothetical protein
MPVFGKKEDCPASTELLALSEGEFRHGRFPKLRWHLTFCDFCAAEFELYLRFPPLSEEVEAPPIPRHLFQLAESILKRKKVKLPSDRRASRRP